MSQSLPIPAVAESPAGSLEADIRRWGERVFDSMERAERSSFFSKRTLYTTMMDWAMRDRHFKTQLFRFVDVLPSLKSSAAVASHLREYLNEPGLKLSPALKLALKTSAGFPWLLGIGVKAQVSSLARQFMLDANERSIVKTLRARERKGIGFTVDILGETVVSEAEADAYAARYLAVLNMLARETTNWGPVGPANLGAQGPVPRLNLSIKISALCSQPDPADPDRALAEISARLRPILRRAKEVQALVNFDMEQHGLKALTLRLFQTVLAEAEFGDGPAAGLALQAYLRDSEADLRDLISWAQTQRRRITIRLVKGAYWDYETVIAQQRGWPCPVFTSKAATDANFEKLSQILLTHPAVVEAAFGTHNVRSVAHVLALAEQLGLDARAYEFQMLYGMADSLKSSLVELGFRVREYCPVGELLPGMAYLVRRLLENTSNEGFLAKVQTRTASRVELLRSPEETDPPLPPTIEMVHRVDFHNEPPADFTIADERGRMGMALQHVRCGFGQRYPLIINNNPVETQDWLPSLNPANQNEVVGYAAQAGIREADAALTAANSARFRWARTPVDQRVALLRRLADLLRREKSSLAALEILEAGKTWAEADADVAESIDFCNFYAAVMQHMGHFERTQHVLGESNDQHWWPRGVGLIIAPWNFPLAILTGMTTAAVVTGNSVLMKPSDQTPIIAARFMALLQEAGLPPGVVNLVTGPGATVGSYLVAHPGIDFIAFTGSKEVGLKLWEAAGRTLPGQHGLKKVICEMGGKNALIVDSDADLDEAVTGILSSAFGYQGQKCSALSRLIVLDDIYSHFLPRLVAAAQSIRVGPAEEPGNQMGPVISRSAQERILKAIEAGKSQATLAWQGRVPKDPDACYVPPVLFTNVPPTSRLFREEIFGPVLAITRAKDFAGALALANDSEFALTGGLYSRSPRHIEQARAEFVCGNLYINRPITGALVERQPFGGFKMSGGGTKAGGREYLINFMVPRVVTENCLRRGFAGD